jgi:hypothetical protein
LSFSGFPVYCRPIINFILFMATTTTKKATSPATRTAATSRAAAPKVTSRPNIPLFGKENYRWMLIGIIIIALGLILMGGGKSKDPNVFNPKEVYSFTRITIAPILILGGFVVEIFAIFRKDKKSA